jgi:hypothetical protein
MKEDDDHDDFHMLKTVLYSMWTLPDLTNSSILLRWASKHQPTHTHTHTHTHNIHAYITVLMLQAIQPPPRPQTPKKKSSRKRMLQDLIKNYSNYSWMRHTDPRSLLPLPSPGAVDLLLQQARFRSSHERGFLCLFLSEHEIADDSSWVVLWHIRASVCRRAEILTATSKDRERPLFFLSLSPSLEEEFLPPTIATLLCWSKP